MLLLVFQTLCFLCTEVTGHIEDNIYLFVVLIILLESEEQTFKTEVSSVKA